jgi:transposase
LDETLFARVGPWRRQSWSTSIVDVEAGRLLDVVPGRSTVEPCKWLAARGQAWLANIRRATLDLSGPYGAVFDTMVPDATQVADPFHLIKLANTKLDECRRRVQNETMGHRGRKDDPLYRARRLLTKAHERLDDRGDAKLAGLLAAGDARGEVRMAWHAKEVVRSIYDIPDPQVAAEFVASSVTTSKTRTAHPRSISSAARSCGGATRSRPGIKRSSPTPRPRRPTT